MMTRFNVLKIKIQQLKSMVEQRAASEVRRELVSRHSGLAPGTLRYISHCESYHLIRGNCRAVSRDLHTECNMFILSTFQSRATDYKVTARSRLSRYRSKLSQRVNYFTADLCPCKAAVNPAASDSTLQTRTRGFASNSSATQHLQFTFFGKLIWPDRW